MSRKTLLKTKLLATLIFLHLAVSIGNGVEAGKDRDRASEEPGDSEPAGSNPVSMSTGSGSGGGGGGGGSNKYDKYGEKYPSGASSLYPSASQQQANAVNYYSAYGYPNSNGMGNSYNYNNGNSPQASNYYSNPYLAEPYYERNGRDFSTRASNNIAMASTGSNFGYESKDQDTGPEFGGQALASSHGHGHGHGGHGHGHGGGHGGGWGWKPSGHGGKSDSSALGLLGLLGLISLLSNILQGLTTTTTTTARMGRRKRELAGETDVTEDTPQEDGIQRANRITLMVLPALNLIAHARDGRVPLDCTHREMCVANQMLVKELGVQGRSVGSMISSAVTKLLKEADDSGSIGKHITRASLAGRNGHDCSIIYPVCPALHKEGPYSLPLLMQPHHFAHLNFPQPSNTYIPKPNLY